MSIKFQILQSASSYILYNTKSKLMPINIIDLCRLETIRCWFLKQDSTTQKVLVAGINAQHEKWSNFTPVATVIAPFLTIFFTLLITFSITYMNIGTNLSINVASGNIELSDEYTKQLGSIETFLDSTLGGDIEFVIKSLFSFVICYIFIVVLYYWNLHRITKLKNIVNISFDEINKTER
ncbi:hypothetical protein MPH47_04220 [Psychrobacillus psychrodurans]|uniref:hypothetical protein n=1 Tax=Psychrobacillus psychrodurans TaxID=126157 RepID=UPI001F4E8418|nr:hypothetical protein [Psychrobacillus psychrodurans]MCK1996451.1 hypothetical protein [Psychrobacillus psychrodurans]